MMNLISMALWVGLVAALGKMWMMKIKIISYEAQWKELDSRNTEAQVALQEFIDNSPLTPPAVNQLSRVVGILQGEDE